MPSPFLALPGAVDIADAGVPAHYGSPLSEQRALAEGRAIVDLSDRAVLSVTGPDRLSWLNSLTSQSLLGLRPGESSETLLLDVTGRLEHAVRVVDDGVTTWLLVDAAEAPSLLAWLDGMRFMLRVEVADRTAELATIGTLGDPALPIAAPNGVPAHLARSVARRGPRRPPVRAGRASRGRLVVERAARAPGCARVRRHPGCSGRVRRRGNAGLRRPADRGLASAFRDGGRREDHPARAGLAANGRAPQQGLLPRPGDGRQGAQPRASAAPPRDAAPRRVGGCASGAGRPRDARRQRGRPGDVLRAALRAGPDRPRGGQAVDRPGRRTDRGRATARRSPPPRRSSCRRRRVQRRTCRGCPGSGPSPVSRAS